MSVINNYKLGITILDTEIRNNIVHLVWVLYDRIKLNHFFKKKQFIKNHYNEWLTFYNENIESISLHSAYKLYPKTKKLLKQANIEILQIKYINNKAIAIIKTFWLKVFQRKIKYYLLKKKHINFNKLKKRELTGLY